MLVQKHVTPGTIFICRCNPTHDEFRRIYVCQFTALHSFISRLNNFSLTIVPTMKRNLQVTGNACRDLFGNPTLGFIRKGKCQLRKLCRIVPGRTKANVSLESCPLGFLMQGTSSLNRPTKRHGLDDRKQQVRKHILEPDGNFWVVKQKTRMLLVHIRRQH